MSKSNRKKGAIPPSKSKSPEPASPERSTTEFFGSSISLSKHKILLWILMAALCSVVLTACSRSKPRQLIDLSTRSSHSSILLREKNAKTLDYWFGCAVVHTDATVSCNRPIENEADWTDIVSVCLSEINAYGLKMDGTVVQAEQLDYAVPPKTPVSDWRDIVDIEQYMGRPIGLRADGTIAVENPGEDENTDRFLTWKNIVSIDSRFSYCAGLRSDGTVMDTYQTDLSDFTDIVEIAAGEGGRLCCLRRDGTVLTRGFGDDQTQQEVSAWRDIVSVAASLYGPIGIKADGSVVITQYMAENGCRDLLHWTDIAAVAPGGELAIRKNGTLIWAEAEDQWLWDECKNWKNIRLPERAMTKPATAGRSAK